MEGVEFVIRSQAGLWKSQLAEYQTAEGDGTSHMEPGSAHAAEWLASLKWQLAFVCLTRTRVRYSLNAPTMQGNYSLIRFGLGSFLVGTGATGINWILQLECARLWRSGRSSHGTYDLACLIWF